MFNFKNNDWQPARELMARWRDDLLEEYPDAEIEVTLTQHTIEILDWF